MSNILYEDPKGAEGAKKPQIHLVPPSAIIIMAECMQNGATKYSPYNWRQGHPVNYTTYLSAAMRHILALVDGEDLAEDSKKHHLGHAMSGLAVVYDAMVQGVLYDDRPTKSKKPLYDVTAREDL